MSHPLVSVVIATRNRPDMVREAIAAVAGQDYEGPVEVVLVFDQSEPDPTLGSDDTTLPVRLFQNQRSAGLAGARNTGIEAAGGEFVAFCDDDDLWLPTKLRKQMAELQAHPEAILCTTGIIVRYSETDHVRELESAEVTFEELLSDRLTELHPSTFVFRRQGLVEIGMVDEAVPGGFGEDYDVLLRVARRHAVLNVREALTVIRWGGQSYFFQRWKTMDEGLSWLLSRHPEFIKSARGSARITGQIAFARAAQGRRRDAVRTARLSIRHRWSEPRAYLALGVASGLLTPGAVMRSLHKLGKGI